MKSHTVPLLNLRNRLERARRTFAQKDYRLTSEILAQLEAEGHSGPEIVQLRRELDEVLRKDYADRSLASARRFLEHDEYSIALRKIQSVLDVNPLHPPALALKKDVEAKLADRKVAGLLQLAATHLANSSFPLARQVTQEALTLHPNDSQAILLLNEIDQTQKELLRRSEEHERIYQAAQTAFQQGAIETALEKLEHLHRLIGHSNQKTDRVREYEEFRRHVRSEHIALKKALEQARLSLAAGDLSAAQQLCHRFLTSYPKHAEFETVAAQLALKQEEQASAYRRSIAQALGDEPGLDRQAEILRAALAIRPDDTFFLRQMEALRLKQNDVAALVQNARELEECGSFDQAIAKWFALRDLDPRFPALQDQIDRAKALWNRQRALAKADLLGRARTSLDQADHAAAASHLLVAASEFPNDPDFENLSRQRHNQIEKFTKVQTLLQQSQTHLTEHRTAEALHGYRSVLETASDLEPLRNLAFTAVLEHAANITPTNWRAAESMLDTAAALHPHLTIPAGHRAAIQHHQREEEIARVLRRVADQDPAADSSESRALLLSALQRFPAESRLRSCLESFDTSLIERRRWQERQACLQDLATLQTHAQQISDPTRIWDLQTRCKWLSSAFSSDPEIASIAAGIAEQLSSYVTASTLLMHGKAKDCLAICIQVLAERPDYRIFLDLQQAAANRLRELALEHLERVERWLAAEPDLNNREQILSRALNDYPGDPDFTAHLNQILNEKSFVNAIAEEAASLENAGLYLEAEQQWNHLQAVYPVYPGIAAAIARCAALQDQAHRKRQAQEMIAEGHANFEHGLFLQGAEHLRQAALHVPDLPHMVQSCAQNLVYFAGQVSPASPQLAKDMIALAQSFDPAVEIPLELRSGMLGFLKRTRLLAPRKLKSGE